MLIDLLSMMIQKGGSDLHISSGSKPRIRKDSILLEIEEYPVFSQEDTKNLCYSILSDKQKSRFETESEIDLSFGLKGLSRFRASIFMQRGAVAGSFRAIPFDIKGIDELGLPQAVRELADRKQGLVIVSGPRSSGKSTTLASMVDAINNKRPCHIITLEDPLEFLHSHKIALVNQREINNDAPSLVKSVRGILRQDPDVVLFGEIGDYDAAEGAMKIAETGHLVLTSMSTNSALLTIRRIVEMFPPHQHEQVRFKLASVLEGVVSQQLLPRKDGSGRIAIAEVLIPTAAVRSLIREDNLKQIYALMQGMQDMKTMNQSIFELFERDIIDRKTALSASPVPEELTLLLNKSSLINKPKPKSP